MRKVTVGKSLTTKQAWILSTVALSGGLTKYSLEKLLAQTFWPGRSFIGLPRLSDHESRNMRTTLDLLVKAGYLKKVKGERDVTLYHIGSHIPGLPNAKQPYENNGLSI